jgi:NTE family protein
MKSYLDGMKSENTREIRNLIFEGGGIKGIAYIGALKNAQTKNLFNFEDIINIGGTSAGAITGFLLALDYSLDEMEDILREFDITEIFLDDDSIKNEFLEIKENFTSNLLVNTFRVGKFLKKISDSFGLFPGKEFIKFCETKIAAKLGRHATFRDLQERIEQGGEGNKFKFLYLIGSNLTTGDSETFSHIDTPDMIISDAVRISMSIPLIWPPHKYYIKNELNERVVRTDRQNDNYVDGGLLNNYPIGIFDRKVVTRNSESIFFNSETLGFRLSKPFKSYAKQQPHDEETGGELIFPYLTSLFNFYFKKEEINHTKRDHDQLRTVYIDSLGLSALDFNLTRDAMDNLIESGRRAVDEFLDFNGQGDGDDDHKSEFIRL